MIADLIPWMQSRAGMLDREAEFPGEEIAWLRRQGVLAPLPPDRSAEMLIQAGQGNLSVGRIIEAHVNALHLIACYGSPAQQRDAREDGLLHALWVTDPPDGGLRMRQTGNGIALEGGKQFCSGAGHADAAVVTATDPEGDVRMLALRLNGEARVTPLPSPLQGMRSAVTGAVDFTGCVLSADAILGQPGDYLREPVFSIGAWRGSAVALGGLIALLDHAIAQLAKTGRLQSPHAQARLGQALIGRESSRHWVNAAARIAEDTNADAGYRIATVGLARIAVEAACLDAMRLVQRSLGLSTFRQGNPIELVCRDLSTYLRQPAPDEVLTEAAAWFSDHPMAST